MPDVRNLNSVLIGSENATLSHLDTTTAVRIFFTKVARTRSIPFRLSAEPEFTPDQEARILEAWEESKDPANISGPYTDVAEMFRDIHRQIADEEAATAPTTP